MVTIHSIHIYCSLMIPVISSGMLSEGDTEDDHGLGVLQTLDGGFIITGSTNNYGNGNVFNSDLLLLKTDANGLMVKFNI